MEVRIVEFPETRLAVAQHRGAPEFEYETSKKLIEWRIKNRISPATGQTYGIHYNDPFTVNPADHRVDFCVSFDLPIEPNPWCITSKIIPALRCALARHKGARSYNAAAMYLHQEWLPNSKEKLGDFPMFFHYVNVGPNILEEDMITDVYLPLQF